ncbi:MAG: DNA mismatch repair protein MutS [Peptococcaceae bacterium]|nr:DNA mismatch repair protein MutS [Peptococcaceae bacterium]
MKKPEQVYNSLIKKYQALIAELTRYINLISNLRLIVFLSGAGLAIYLFVKKNYSLLASELIIFLGVFIYLVYLHNRYFKQKEHFSLLLRINENSLKRLQGKWSDFADDGEEFKDANHPYTEDLDIFGPGSLFQFLNTAVTPWGRYRLRDLLISTPKNIEEITARQKATSELAPKLNWRQELMAQGLKSSKMRDPQALIAWVYRPEGFYRKKAVIIALRALPILTIIWGLITLINPDINYYGIVALLLIQFISLKIRASKRSKCLELTHTYAKDIGAYCQMLKCIETEQFDSVYLQALKAGLQNTRRLPAWQQLNKLTKLAENFANRHNPIYGIFNIVFLLDYQFMLALEKWKENFGHSLQTWLEVIGEFEALASLSVAQHDYPQWVLPEFIADRPYFAAQEMGHPLLYYRVTNNLTFSEPANILLITGSNMSGKSTLLRTAGINLILAYAGTVVCAKKFTCSLMAVYTCMRVNDNLEKRISSFYAELLRIKMVVQAAEEDKTIFVLLDEIFKGTNSIDRHTGAKALLKKLSSHRLLGLISTHDLELTALAQENPKIKNYYFQEYYKNNKICFDYILRPGVSTTRNAAYLMKMAGIDITD